MDKLLFVLGAQKTGTSTLVGMLNCHPNIFVMHEWFVDTSPTRHGQFCFIAYPKIKKFFKHYKKISAPSEKLFARIAKRFAGEYQYKYVGDKWAIIGDKSNIDQRIKTFEDIKVIFAIRDIRTWVCHGSIQKMYKNQNNIVPSAVDFAYYYISSFKLKRCIRIRLEDISNYEIEIKRISQFLSPIITDFVSHGNKWWNKIGIPKYGYNTSPKTMHKWWIRHGSAKVRPLLPHISVELYQHPFWDVILPIFDKYYNNHMKKFSIDEIENDLELLTSAKNKYAASMSECYKNININNYKVKNGM